MKPPKSSSQTPTLNDLIEIIREPQQPSTSDISFPPDVDDSNPIYTLSKLVEKLDSLVDSGLHRTTDTTSPPARDSQMSGVRISQIELYVELLQKHNAVLRKVMNKLH